MHAQSLNRVFIAMWSVLYTHRLEVFAKMRVMGAMGPTHTQPLKKEKAEVGAEILGETFIYTIAAPFTV